MTEIDPRDTENGQGEPGPQPTEPDRVEETGEDAEPLPEPAPTEAEPSADDES